MVVIHYLLRDRDETNNNDDNGVKHIPITVQLTENRLKKPAIATILTEIREYLFLGNWVTTR